MSREENNWLLFSTKVIQNNIVQQQEHFLNNILNKVAAELSFCHACEIIDINRCKIITSANYVKSTIYQYYENPFVFVFCKN
jgi:hypothetical protein